jgi:hypothetical protein
MKDEMTAQQLGNLIGITASRVRELTRQGVLARDGDGGTYVVARNVKSAFAHLRAGAAGRGGKAAAAVSAERARLLAVQRKRAEHEFERELSKWIPADEVARQWAHRFSGIKAQIMALSSRFSYLDHTTVAQIDKEAREFLDSIAAGEYDVAPP